MASQQSHSPPAGAPNNNNNQYQSQRRQRAQSMGHYYPQQQQFARSQGPGQYGNGNGNGTGNGPQGQQQSHYQHPQQQTRGNNNANNQQPRYQPSYSQTYIARNNNNNQYGQAQRQNNPNGGNARNTMSYSLSPQPTKPANPTCMNGVPVPPLTKLAHSRSYGRMEMDRAKSFSPNSSIHSHPTPTYGHAQSGSPNNAGQLPIIGAMQPVQSAPKMNMSLSMNANQNPGTTPRLNSSASAVQLLPNAQSHHSHASMGHGTHGTHAHTHHPGMNRSHSARSSLVSNHSLPSHASMGHPSHASSIRSHQSSIVLSVGPGGSRQPVQNIDDMVILDDEFNDDPIDDALLNDMSIPMGPDELLGNFEDLGIEIGNTPSPPPMAPLQLKSAAKPSINLDNANNAPSPLPKFKSVDEAKKASDEQLEAGFTMLASPTASVQTEYNDSEDLTQNNEDKDAK
eukprot:CAMPEP_0201583660 /NCGR_PEP_ID=MMETSP0190_2-20130828/100923_1 /ASSEMBLY_ACC=CAM_ASM_000263 /TAXON_ID=37353 /ORGANISM="Rosalina sp." /LENGTH=453 /DNA_ID=CAMNT_0048025969 /DNA_START=1315 /DNA_END=2676 /DNA_ORIENTATION=-